MRYVKRGTAVYRNPIFEVRVEYDCPVCSGQGMVIHPLWEQCRAEGHREDWEAVVRFFDNLQIEMPDEEVVCSECKGGGRATTWFPIEEAIKYLAP